MRKDRVGEKNYNNFGSEMIITEYRKYKDIDIYFPEYKWTSRHKTYQSFIQGTVKCPYDKSIFGIGYIGEGPYKTKNGNKPTRAYYTWKHMLERCYDSACQEKKPTYKDCVVYDEWHNFQNFAKWYEENYYEIPGEMMCIDKDIIVKDNRVYGPDTCVFVPQCINMLFTKHNNKCKDLPTGVYLSGENGRYIARCSMKYKNINLGNYDTQEEAFCAYKRFKENKVKELADKYKDYIPKTLYDTLYEYEVEEVVN